ncbi:interleukin-18 isoform X1 [Rhinatrema bivittatum]|uniref:interleukin-18 isoform X1 n=1 Tax=Rhinatrema bivittatum TaxID=194408 RepID=UPI00112CCDBC|nr:interleukin-18 isoform X1 [Rhinatrema bivittatum]XP_029428116.1 interleukin-18 isoform X1 [Rhinatrema bivittatum]
MRRHPVLSPDGSNKFTACDETDFWKRHGKTSSEVLIKNWVHETLVVYPEAADSCIVFESRTRQQRFQDDCSIKLHEYRDTGPREGISVALTVQKGRKSYLIYCTSEKTLQLKEGNALLSIPGDRSEYIFYQKDFREGDTEAFSFESSFLAGYYLASEQENGQKKMILRKSRGEVDEELRMQVIYV